MPATGKPLTRRAPICLCRVSCGPAILSRASSAVTHAAGTPASIARASIARASSALVPNSAPPGDRRLAAAAPVRDPRPGQVQLAVDQRGPCWWRGRRTRPAGNSPPARPYRSTAATSSRHDRMSRTRLRQGFVRPEHPAPRYSLVIPGWLSGRGLITVWMRIRLPHRKPV